MDGAKKLFRELLVASQPLTVLQGFVQSRPDLLGRQESSVLDEVANTHRSGPLCDDSMFVVSRC